MESLKSYNILYLKSQTSQISSAQWSQVASGYDTGQSMLEFYNVSSSALGSRADKVCCEHAVQTASFLKEAL